MTIKIEEIDNCVVLSLKGNLIQGIDTDELKNIVKKQILSDKKNIIIDLGEIKHINSTGLSVLFRGYKSVVEAGGKFRIVNINSKLKNLLSITKLDTLFAIEKNVDSAIKNLSKKGSL